MPSAGGAVAAEWVYLSFCLQGWTCSSGRQGGRVGVRGEVLRRRCVRGAGGQASWGDLRGQGRPLLEAKGRGVLTRVVQLWGRTVSFTEALRRVVESGGHAYISTRLLLFKYALSFHTVHGVLKARILKWLAIPFSSGPQFVRTLHRDPPVLSGPTRHGS